MTRGVDVSGIEEEEVGSGGGAGIGCRRPIEAIATGVAEGAITRAHIAATDEGEEFFYYKILELQDHLG